MHVILFLTSLLLITQTTVATEPKYERKCVFHILGQEYRKDVFKDPRNVRDSEIFGYIYGPDGKVINLTNRRIATFDKVLPPSFRDWDSFAGKAVADTSCGGGMMVEDLKGRGAKASGVDLDLEPHQLDLGYLHVGNAQNMPFFPDGSQAAAFNYYGAFFYPPRQGARDYLRRVLAEHRRVLTEGGVLRVFPADRLIDGIGEVFPGFRVTKKVQVEDVWALELTKE